MTSEAIPVVSTPVRLVPSLPLLAPGLSGSGLLMVTDVRLQLLGMALFYGGLLLAAAGTAHHVIARQPLSGTLTAMLLLFVATLGMSPALPESVQDVLVVLLP
ncbi:MAG: hypothetical protein MI751_15375 [Pseudomonadales bacterium]|nr:hypothetical protein [Pseudomonadales bacterium]MEE2869649.1 hypothetical protein [Pseudomonadota bacterium]